MKRLEMRNGEVVDAQAMERRLSCDHGDWEDVSDNRKNGYCSECGEFVSFEFREGNDE